MRPRRSREYKSSLIKNPQGTEDFDAKGLAELFEASLGIRLRTPRSRLARAISEILNNKLTPTRLYNEVGNFVTDVSNKLMDDSPEIIEKILAFGECGYLLCPGTADGSVCPGLDAHPKDGEKDKE
jgi:hypothetical protein